VKLSSCSSFFVAFYRSSFSFSFFFPRNFLKAFGAFCWEKLFLSFFHKKKSELFFCLEGRRSWRFLWRIIILEAVAVVVVAAALPRTWSNAAHSKDSLSSAKLSCVVVALSWERFVEGFCFCFCLQFVGSFRSFMLTSVR
jgi:hypothetical protein